MPHPHLYHQQKSRKIFPIEELTLRIVFVWMVYVQVVFVCFVLFCCAGKKGKRNQVLSVCALLCMRNIFPVDARQWEGTQEFPFCCSPAVLHELSKNLQLRTQKELTSTRSVARMCPVPMKVACRVTVLEWRL